ncbi:MAG: EamA family transporter [Verrucomicrobiales bacterium]
MLTVLIILFGGLIFETIGIVYMSHGLKRLRGLDHYDFRSILAFIGRIFRNNGVLVGTLFQAIYFFSLIYLLAKADVSFIWPLTSLGFVSSTVAAAYFLHENVPPLRWVGILLIMLGAALVTYTETQKPQPVSADQAP